MSDGGRRPVVLVIDDEAALRRVLVALLTRGRFDAVPAVDGADALARLGAGLEPDIALIDLRMPAMNGETVLRKLRAAGHRFPALLTSASLRTEQAVAEMGFDAFVSKPYQFAALLDLMRRVLAGTGEPPRRPGHPAD